MNNVFNIAVVDDEIDLSLLYKVYFRKEIKKNIIRLFFFANGLDCVKFLNSDNKPEQLLILSDINMPIMNGLEMLKEVNINFPQTDIFIVSAYENSAYAREAERLGAELFITKPIDFKYLRSEINKKMTK